MITVVGVGLEKGDITIKGRKAIKEAACVFSRVKLWFKTEVLADKFPDVSDYAALDSLIANKVLDAEKQSGNVVYCALGDGFTDSAVSEMAKISTVNVIAGVSEYRGRTPDSEAVFYSAYDVTGDTLIDTRVPLIVYGIDDKLIAGNLKLVLMDRYGDEAEAVYSSGKERSVIRLYELDRMKSYKGGALFISGKRSLTQKSRYGLSDLMEVMSRLTAPDGCPWDKAQTHESIRINMIEEAYEAVDAIDKNDIDNLREELGDVLLQAVFHCNISERTGEFTLCDTVSELVNKLVTRHTHIFGENKASDADSALGFWEQAKAKEKSYDSLSGQLDRLPDSFPALLKAAKAYKKSVKAGAELSKEAVLSRLNGILKEGIGKENAGRFLLLASFLATESGADCEAELNKRASKFIEDMKAAETAGELNRASEKI